MSTKPPIHKLALAEPPASGWVIVCGKQMKPELKVRTIWNTITCPDCLSMKGMSIREQYALRMKYQQRVPL